MTLSAQELLGVVLGRDPLELAGVIGAVAESWASRGVLLMLLDPGSSTLRVAATHPASAEADQVLRIPVGYGVMGLVASNNQGAVLEHDSPRDPVHRRVLGLDDGESVARLCVPVNGLPGEVIGVLSLHREERRPYTVDEQIAVQHLAGVLGLRIAAEQLGEQARKSHSQRDELIAQAISAQEAERRRIAGDLHDGVTQALVSLDYHLSAASTSLEVREFAETQTQIAAARGLSSLAFDETRAAISGLHSLILDDLGLVSALESLAQTVTSSSPMRVDFLCDADPALDDLADHTAAALYRIAQEALNNAVKHADADRAVVSLRRAGDATVLAVTDDGSGFDAQKVRSRSLSSGDAEHYGLSSIAERCALIGASLRVDSVEGRGTAVIVELAG
ncbi:two-component system, NarL family, sensor kinase [Marmoricola sp. URHA0025 HA25]